jgi:dCTP deaminase
MIKPDHWILYWGSDGGVVPYTPEHINAASYDVALGDHWICPTREPQEFWADSIKLFPGEVVLASTIEYIKIPRDVAADLKLKSTIGRLWINHSMAGWFDPGFEGNITLELQNLGPEPFILEKGRRIAQLIFMGLDSEPAIAYGDPGSGSHYQGQRGTTRAKSD